MNTKSQVKLARIALMQLDLIERYNQAQKNIENRMFPRNIDYWRISNYAKIQKRLHDLFQKTLINDLLDWEYFEEHYGKDFVQSIDFDQIYNWFEDEMEGIQQGGFEDGIEYNKKWKI